MFAGLRDSITPKRSKDGNELEVKFFHSTMVSKNESDESQAHSFQDPQSKGANLREEVQTDHFSHIFEGAVVIRVDPQ